MRAQFMLMCTVRLHMLFMRPAARGVRSSHDSTICMQHCQDSTFSTDMFKELLGGALLCYSAAGNCGL